MNYLKIYCNLIRKAENRIPPEDYTEKHHIFPVSIYGKNNRIVILSGREHYIAHALLEKICIQRYGLNHWKTYKMSAAHSLMKDGTRYYNSYLYECARKRWGKMHSEKMKGSSPWNKGRKGYQVAWNRGIKTGSFAERTEEWNRKIGESQKGKVLTDEHRQKISKALKGRPLGEKARIAMINSHKKRVNSQNKGKFWWNDGQNEKMSVECPGDNWTKGRCAKVS